MGSYFSSPSSPPHSTQTNQIEDLYTYLFDTLKKRSVAIPILNVEQSFSLITEPKDFYDQLCQGIQRSKNRIYLSSLYLGIGHHEQHLVQLMLQQMEKEPNLKIVILLDCLRGTRGNNIPKPNTSSTKMLLPLLEQFGSERVQICLYHTPNLNGLWKRVLPERLNEVVGVQHMKTYIFDHDMIISGANLSDWYFVDRQDRYMLIKNQTNLTNYFCDLINTVNQFSYELNVNNQLALHHQCKYDPIKQSNQFKLFAQDLIHSFLKQQSQQQSFHHNTDTFIFPSIQIGNINIRNDETITLDLIETSHVVPHSKLFLSSAYFNMTKQYISILKPKMNIDIITSSPKCNGFYTATDVYSRQIPFMYSFIEQSFFEKSTSQHIRIFEYVREKWTYHAKGLWIYDSKTNQPILTMIGSPNFGRRSVERDLEAQLVIVTRNQHLQSLLDHERQNLFQYAHLVNKSVFEHPERKVGFIVSLLTRIMHKFL